MVEDSLKGVIRAAGWLQLDLILYGPRTVLNSFGFTNLFGRSSESTSRQFSDKWADKSTKFKQKFQKKIKVMHNEVLNFMSSTSHHPIWL